MSSFQCSSIIFTHDRVQLFSSARALHRGGIVHGDFEPRNIVVQPDGHVVIVDFGCSEVHACNGSCTEILALAERLEIDPFLAVHHYHHSSLWTCFALAAFTLFVSGLLLLK